MTWFMRSCIFFHTYFKRKRDALCAATEVPRSRCDIDDSSSPLSVEHSNIFTEHTKLLHLLTLSYKKLCWNILSVPNLFPSHLEKRKLLVSDLLQYIVHTDSEIANNLSLLCALTSYCYLPSCYPQREVKKKLYILLTCKSKTIFRQPAKTW